MGIMPNPKSQKSALIKMPKTKIIRMLSNSAISKIVKKFKNFFD